MMRKTDRILLILGAFLLLLGVVLAAFRDVATDGRTYIALQERIDVYAYVGVPKAELDEAMLDLGARLRRGEDISSPEVTMFGERNPLFNAREMAHMEDVCRLFLWLKWTVWAACALGELSLLAGALRARPTRRQWLGALSLGAGALALVLGAIAVYAACDFEGAFLLFHRLCFRNELWLLDPATDAMIRMFSGTFFADLVVLAARKMLLYAALFAAAGVVLSLPMKRRVCEGEGKP